MRNIILAAAFVVCLSFEAAAKCECRCVDGQNRPVCDSSMDLEPLCPPRLCPLVPPVIRPIEEPRLPPLGWSSCSQKQVLNPATNQYEWQKVCE